jgi:TRAP-type mannitol/chloroaromatic compound transport system permease small subunit
MTGESKGGVPRLLDAVDRLSLLGGWMAAVCIAAILVLIVAEVLARNLFNYSIDFAWEFSAYFMGAAFMLGAGYALRAGAQIRVNLLLENVPRPLARAIDLFATLVGIVVAAFLTYALVDMTWLSWTRNSRSVQPSDLPLWIPQASLAVGSLLLTLQTVSRLGRLLRGEPGEDMRLRIGQDIE